MRNLCGSLALVILSVEAVFAQDGADNRPFGLERRVSWTTSRVRGSPDPPAPYRVEPAFPKIKFAEPLDMAVAPGSNRIFVAEQHGMIFSFPTDASVEKADLFLDLGKVIYGIVFDPNYQSNGYCYVTYVMDASKEEPLGTRVSRFRSSGTPPKCDPQSELVIIEWPSGGHNGGCLQFGPDGFLYIATGDASGIADEYQTGQNLSVLPGKILRIDVRNADAGKRYTIPSDNPFLEVEGARPEIWAYGLRQPWKMSFDRASGELWTGNVGQDLWEQIYRIERGGNYGWSIVEGSHPFRPERKRGPTPIQMPIVEHNHSEFRSITGGFVYRGTRLPELVGAYVYGDYDTGRIWSLRYDGTKVTEHRELVDSTLRLVGFGEDGSGELYLLDHMGGGIHRLARNDVAVTASDFPRKLSDTGLFVSVKDHQLAPGVIPYSIIAPSWSDGALKQWFLALPGSSQIEFEAIEFPQPAPGAHRGWKFPEGTVLVETISLELERGNAASRRRIETRILHNERLAGTEAVGDQYWRGYSYVWNDDQTDAVLLENKDGLDRTYSIVDATLPQGKRQQTWHFPSRAECTVCHNMAAKYVLGMNTLQVNRNHDYGAAVDNQLRAFDHIGLFTKPLPASPAELPRLVDYRDATQEIDQRARSYLHANCSYCHRKWGGGNAEFQLLFSLELEQTGALGTRPGQGTFYIPDAAVITPGDPLRSLLYYRMSKVGPGRMPRAGSNEVDPAGVKLIRDWIANIPTAGASPETAPTDRLRSDRMAIERLTEASRASRMLPSNDIDYLLATTTGALRLGAAIDDAVFAPAIARELIERGSRHSEAHIRDLFERYLPEEARTKRLGNVVRPEQILALGGDSERGRQVFFKTEGVACKTCHRIEGTGGEVGPDLSEIGKKYDRDRLLDTILNPSKEIDPKYQTYLVATKSGQIHSGVLVERTSQRVALRDAQNKLIEIAADDVEQLQPQQQSIMPDLLLRDLTAQQVADLTEFLSSLRGMTK